jgi:hypothetical protein
MVTSELDDDVDDPSGLVLDELFVVVWHCMPPKGRVDCG